MPVITVSCSNAWLMGSRRCKIGHIGQGRVTDRADIVCLYHMCAALLHAPSCHTTTLCVLFWTHMNILKTKCLDCLIFKSVERSHFPEFRYYLGSSRLCSKVIKTVKIREIEHCAFSIFKSFFCMYLYSLYVTHNIQNPHQIHLITAMITSCRNAKFQLYLNNYEVQNNT